MPYAPKVESLPAAFWTDRKGSAIVAIIAHGTGGTDSRQYLKTGGGRAVSIHVLIDKKGTIYKMLDDPLGANHAGAASSRFTLLGKTYTGAAVNRSTLGFELENLQDGRDPYTDAQLLATGWQIVQWRARYGPLPILRHGDLDPTRRRDPWKLSVEELERWAQEAARLIAPPKFTHTARYRAAVFEREWGTGPVWGVLEKGEQVSVDKTYPAATAHLVDGRGFVRLEDLIEETR